MRLLSKTGWSRSILQRDMLNLPLAISETNGSVGSWRSVTPLTQGEAALRSCVCRLFIFKFGFMPCYLFVVLPCENSGLRLCRPIQAPKDKQQGYLEGSCHWRLWDGHPTANLCENFSPKINQHGEIGLHVWQAVFFCIQKQSKTHRFHKFT